MRFNMFSESALKCIILLIVMTLVQYSLGGWAEDKLKELEADCDGLSYDALTYRYISILGVYKYMDNPPRSDSSKCYQRMKQLGDERLARHQEQIKKFENPRKDYYNDVDQRRNEEKAKQQKQNQIEQDKRNKEKEETSSISTVIIVGIVLLAIVLIGSAVLCAGRGGATGTVSTAPVAGQPLLSPHQAHVTSTGGFNSSNTETQFPQVPHLPAPRPRSPVPLINQRPIVDTKIDLDEPPSYHEAIGMEVPLPSAPPKDF